MSNNIPAIRLSPFDVADQVSDRERLLSRKKRPSFQTALEASIDVIEATDF